jgi:hypothetical protein
MARSVEDFDSENVFLRGIKGGSDIYFSTGQPQPIGIMSRAKLPLPLLQLLQQYRRAWPRLGHEASNDFKDFNFLANVFLFELEWEWEFQVTGSSHFKSCTLVGLKEELEREWEWKIAGLILPNGHRPADWPERSQASRTVTKLSGGMTLL